MSRVQVQTSNNQSARALSELSSSKPGPSRKIFQGNRQKNGVERQIRTSNSSSEDDCVPYRLEKSGEQ
ncbi:hypothetical protein C0J52_21689 [Blattella germanica]|nr:hypothetical protein C0J52_21689 [Blattella germanica]